MEKLIKSVFWTLVLLAMLLGIPKFAGFVADVFSYASIDPDGSFAWIYVHHIVQTIIFIIIIAGLSRYKSFDFGLGWGNKAAGRKCVLLFMLFFSIYTVGAFSTVIMSGGFEHFTYPLTTNNIIGQMSFQLLMSGPSEELIFRAFAITTLSMFYKGRILGNKVSIANVIAAVIFALAHVRWSIIPFEISYSSFQLVYALVLGIFYGDCYEKSGSVYYPMIMHSFSNVVMVGVTIIASFLIS
ncbi:MAG: CPBP family intramembrane metalloprotease [Eubacteriales bacterium]|nr:CPBP family intramembrane metalloprotease [Eubacteriales bacterium]